MNILRRIGRVCLLSISLFCLVPHALAQSFTISGPASFTIHPGDQNVPVPVTLSAGTATGPVSITLAGLPTGMTVAPLTLAPGSSGTLLVSASVFADRESFPGMTIGVDQAVHTVSLVAASGTQEATASLSLTVSIDNPSYAPTPDQINLPIVRIDTGGTAVTSTEINVPGTITITSADGSTSYLPNSSDSDNTATFHVHGNTTADMPKRPYNVKLNTSLDLLATMGLYCPYNKDLTQSTCDKSKSYILLANYDDKAMLRDWAAFALANAIPMGGDYLSSAAGSPSPSKATLMPWAPHSLFVELYLNGQYEGVYQLTEKVNVDSHRLNIDELSESDTGAGSDDITGGYFMEIDQHKDEAFVFTTPQNVPIGLQDPDFSPDPEVPAQTSYISSYVDQAENALVYGNPADPTTGWRAYFDEAALVNFYLVNEIMGNVDGGDFYSSDYLYKAKDNPLLYMGPVWDFDISAGNVNYQPVSNPTVTWMRTHNAWYPHLFADPTFKADVAAQFNALKKNGVFDAWIASINQEAAALNTGQANNFTRWPIIGTLVWPNAEAAGSYTAEVGFMTTYLQVRMAWLDSILNNKAASTTTLALSPGSAASGDAITLTATVTASSTPTGSVTFLLNGLPGPTTSVGADGTATATVSTLPPDTYSVIAVYSGDSVNALSASAASKLTVSPAPAQTTTAIASSITSITFGDQVALSAQVIPVSGSTAATGTITFTSGTTTLGTASVGTNGTATLTTTLLPGGTDAVTAAYSGDTNYASSTSPAQTIGVLTASTATALTPSATSISFGSPVTLTAKVTPASGSAAATGTITFTAGAATLGTATVGASGTATLTTTLLPTGTDAVTAAYSGDTNYASSASPAQTIAVLSARTTTAITPSATSISFGSPVTLTAKVTPASGSIAATGTVIFATGSTTLGTATIGASETAALTTTLLPTGTDIVTAAYSGDANYASSISPVQTITVAALTPPAAATFNLTSEAQSVATHLNYADAVMQVTPQNGFSGSVTFACTAGLPSGGNCTFSPASVTISSSGSAVSAVRIQLQSTTARNDLPSLAGKAAATLAFALLFWPAGRRRRTIFMTVIALLLVAAGGALSGCGSTGSSTGAASSSINTYSITIQATGGSVTRSTVVQVIQSR